MKKPDLANNPQLDPAEKINSELAPISIEIRITEPFLALEGYINLGAEKFINIVAESNEIGKKNITFALQPYIVDENSDTSTKALENIDLNGENLIKGAIKNDLVRIGKNIISILRNPILVGEMLQGVEASITEDMMQKGISFNDTDLPQYLISGSGFFMPGPPSDDYIPRNKQRMIDGILLNSERQSEINTQYSAKFVGIVEGDVANKFVASGNLFGEDVQVGRTIAHGKFSHRLQNEVIRRAVDCGLIGLALDNGNILTHKELLALMVQTEDNLWNIVIDSQRDTKGNKGINAKIPTPENYIFSCISPFVMNSLILCFGNHIGLPNLQHVMLDSHWKEAQKIVDNVKGQDAEKKLGQKSYGDVYTACMIELATNSFSNPNSSSLTSGPQEQYEQGIKSKKYMETGFPGVVIKPTKPAKEISPKSQPGTSCVVS